MATQKNLGMERRLISIRMHRRHDLYVLSEAPLCFPKISTSYDFDMTLRSVHLRLSLSCDTDLLSFLTRNISKSASFYDRNVIFYPSFSEIVTPQGMASACILFKDGVSLSHWLEVPDVLERQGIMWKASCTKDIKSVRFMGSCQWNELDDTHHIAFFPGKSCSSKMSKNDEVSQRTTAGVNSTDGNEEYLLDYLSLSNSVQL